MQRIFHPVGQGAFFSERFTEAETPLNVVFDCGSTSLNAELRQAKVNSSFRKDEIIDILFISHFHADHINGIEFLMKGRKIKNVVMPYLDDEDKALLKILNLLKEDYLDTEIIDSPETFFGGDTRIIRVFSEGDNRSLNDRLRDGFDIDRDMQDQALASTGQQRFTNIASGTHIRSSRLPFWLFIPYNYKMTERSKPFIAAINEFGLKLTDLNSIEKIQAHKKLLIKAYELVERDLNKTSLILYSGPKRALNDTKCYFNYEPVFFPFEPINHLAGCLYTGDADFNEPNLVSGLKARLSKINVTIGTLVAPHHGAISNFNQKILALVPTLQSAVFPFGKRNAYGHPSDAVIADILGHKVSSGDPDYYWWENPRNMIIRVTEDTRSIAVYKFIVS